MRVRKGGKKGKKAPVDDQLTREAFGSARYRSRPSITPLSGKTTRLFPSVRPVSSLASSLHLGFKANAKKTEWCSTSGFTMVFDGGPRCKRSNTFHNHLPSVSPKLEASIIGSSCTRADRLPPPLPLSLHILRFWPSLVSPFDQKLRQCFVHSNVLYIDSASLDPAVAKTQLPLAVGIWPTSDILWLGQIAAAIGTAQNICLHPVKCSF